MKIWILQTGEPLHCDSSLSRPMRAMSLADALTKAGHNVVLWSSDFYHQEKRARFGKYTISKISENLEIRLIPSPGYIKNVGLGRLWDHLILAKNLNEKLLDEKDYPDLAFLGYPPIEVVSVMIKKLAIRNIPVVVDVKDQWPTIFTDVLPKPFRFLGKFLLYPYFYLGRKVISDATAVCSITPAFLDWAQTFANRDQIKFDLVAPLTSRLNSFRHDDLIVSSKWWDSLGVPNDGRPRLIFIGSHSRAFDMEPILNAAKNCSDCQFVICGDGEYHFEWITKFEGLENVIFPGWVDQLKINTLATRSLAALAPYKNTKDFEMSVPNKVIDYLSLGLPVLSPLLGEVRDLINNYSVGLSYFEEKGIKLDSQIFKLRDNPAIVSQMSKNAKNVYSSMYDHDFVYTRLTEELERIGRHFKK